MARARTCGWAVLNFERVLSLVCLWGGGVEELQVRLLIISVNTEGFAAAGALGSSWLAATGCLHVHCQ